MKRARTVAICNAVLVATLSLASPAGGQISTVDLTALEASFELEPIERTSEAGLLVIRAYAGGGETGHVFLAVDLAGEPAGAVNGRVVARPQTGGLKTTRLTTAHWALVQDRIAMFRAVGPKPPSLVPTPPDDSGEIIQCLDANQLWLDIAYDGVRLAPFAAWSTTCPDSPEYSAASEVVRQARLFVPDCADRPSNAWTPVQYTVLECILSPLPPPVAARP